MNGCWLGHQHLKDTANQVSTTPPTAYALCCYLPNVMVSNLPAISDAILCRAGSADCEMWDGHCHGF
ncbi:hypothetical protein TIFTF001_037021 [Ficus carica]|uniref:Uncharacterized protein n=1 Tax=Ficus carica TaxID=3494 RepID=A0AA88E5D6_FICCA|nr:hypothetical protein TIFTF001_037021 [Ficus carica]